jgi:hypothetical protein
VRQAIGSLAFRGIVSAYDLCRFEAESLMVPLHANWAYILKSKPERLSFSLALARHCEERCDQAIQLDRHGALCAPRDDGGSSRIDDDLNRCAADKRKSAVKRLGSTGPDHFSFIT